MISYYTSTTKRSEVINCIKDLGYHISENNDMYDSAVRNNPDRVIDSGMIIIIGRRESIQIIVPDSLKDSMERQTKIDFIESNVNEITTQEQSTTRRVLESLKRGGIRNHRLLSDLESQIQDPIEKNPEVKDIFIMEPNNGQ